MRERRELTLRSFEEFAHLSHWLIYAQVQWAEARSSTASRLPSRTSTRRCITPHFTLRYRHDDVETMP